MLFVAAYKSIDMTLQMQIKIKHKQILNPWELDIFLAELKIMFLSDFDIKSKKAITKLKIFKFTKNAPKLKSIWSHLIL